MASTNGLTAVSRARASQSQSVGRSIAAQAQSVQRHLGDWQGRPPVRHLPFKVAKAWRQQERQQAAVPPTLARRLQLNDVANRVTDDQPIHARAERRTDSAAVDARLGLPVVVGTRSPLSLPGSTRLGALAAVVVTIVVVGWMALSSSTVVAPSASSTDSLVGDASSSEKSSLDDPGVSSPSRSTLDTPTGTSPAMTTSSTIALPYRVYVSGAVVVPGVVRVGEDARVLDALDLAKGATPDANLDVLNLAAVIHDGDHVHVPRVGDPAGVGGVTSAASNAANNPASVTQTSSKVNLNTASATELETLDGVGPATAQTIIKYRAENGPFSSIDELLNVSGIGPAKLERMRDGLVL